MERTSAAMLVAEFGSLTDQQYADLIALTRARLPGIVNRSPAAIVDQALVYAAGHIWLRGQPQTGGSAGPLTSLSAGNTSLSYGAPQLTGTADDAWKLTGYGVQYLQLRAQLASQHRIG